MQKFYFQQDKFFSEAQSLRNAFEKKFKNPKHTDANRFVWDYWHVPQQYTFVRTPAYHFFPKAVYARFEKALLQWGKQTLGCTAISPPWLSYYIDGCGQEFHSDVPHGPWAYVYSLTPWKDRKFTGGETMLMRPSVLNYWQNFQDSKDRELDSFVEFLPSPFNRLTVFDPRFPHGVSKVQGTQDPREARLVIHGWFVEPKPVLEGPLSAKQVAPILDEAVERFQQKIADYGRMNGTMSTRIKVNASGKVQASLVLANTLLSTEGNGSLVGLESIWKKTVSLLRFPKARGSTAITLPLLFR